MTDEHMDDPPPGIPPPPSPTPSPRPSRGPVILAIVIGITMLLGIAIAGGVLVTSLLGNEPASPSADRDFENSLGTILTKIDASELRMIAFQAQGYAVIDQHEALSEIAQAAHDDLDGMLSDLRATTLVGSHQRAVDAIRDAYARHLKAWVDYVAAVAEDPGRFDPDSEAARPFWADIVSTGEAFVDAVESGLPDGTPRELRDLVELILDRGFRPDADNGILA